VTFWRSAHGFKLAMSECFAAYHSFSAEQVYRTRITVRLFDPKGGRDAGRDFHGAVGSKRTVGGRSPSVECVPVHTVQSEDPIHLQGN
jgi:hypothetical protein